MSNVCSSRFHCIGCKAAAPLFHGKKYVNHHHSVTFSSYSESLAASKAPVTCLPSSLAIATQLSSLDAPQQRSAQWFAQRRDRLTSSTFSTALGFWKGKRRPELWHEKVFLSDVPLMDKSRAAMEWGIHNEAAAIERYKSITGHDVSSLGFAIHSGEQSRWLGASPDGLLGDFPCGGILEVKCPFNKGKPERGSPWSKMPFYHMPQVQGQMEIMDREWVDLYCWMPGGSVIFRVGRERSYWKLIHGILREFWWENVIPAKEALLLGKEDVVSSYKPESTHKRTGFAIAKSLKLAAEAKLLCREVAGQIEFYS